MKKGLGPYIWTLLLLFLAACGGKSDKKGEKEEKKEAKKERKEEKKREEQNTGTSSYRDDNTAINCDTALWKYVYNRERLEVIDKCKTVTGTIEESNADEDGDQHMLLKLDGGQEDLLTKKNKKKKQGDLVIEAVCVNKVLLKKVGTTCQGYVNHILLPKVGDHVRVSGSLVNDTHNGWNEIHPITRVEVIQ